MVFTFNADATPFKGTRPPIPPHPDMRCLFITFSNGFPLTKSQLFNFFNMMYPEHVEDVYVHRPNAQGGCAKPSLFGKVIFTNAAIPDLIMGYREKVCFCMNGLPFYCKRFVTQKSKPSAFSSHSVDTSGGENPEE